MFNHITRFTLEKALSIQIQRSVNSYPNEFYLPHQFSKKFERKMRVLQKRSNRPKAIDFTIQTTKKVSLSFAIILILFMSLVLSVEAFREKFFRFIEQRFSDHSIVSFEPELDNTDIPVQTRFMVYIPKEIPDGFDLIEEIRENDYIQLYYTNPNGQDVIYVQCRIEDSSMFFNTEGVQIETVTFGESEAYYYEKNENISLYWENNTYAFLISGVLNKKDLFNMANSLIIEKL